MASSAGFGRLSIVAEEVAFLKKYMYFWSIPTNIWA
jgi:hypothetical protein